MKRDTNFGENFDSLEIAEFFWREKNCATGKYPLPPPSSLSLSPHTHRVFRMTDDIDHFDMVYSSMDDEDECDTLELESNRSTTTTTTDDEDESRLSELEALLSFCNVFHQDCSGSERNGSPACDDLNEAEEEHADDDEERGVCRLRHDLHAQSDLCERIRELTVANADLMWRVRVLEFQCSYGSHPVAYASIVQIQSMVRGYLARLQKKRLDELVVYILRVCKLRFAMTFALRRKRMVKTIQAAARGRRVRTSLVGRAIGRMLGIVRSQRLGCPLDRIDRVIDRGTQVEWNQN